MASNQQSTLHMQADAASERKNSILVEMTDRRSKANEEAHKLERRIALFWWSSILITGGGVLLGFLSPVIGADKIPAWLVSLIAGFGVALEVARRKAGWRDKANAWYALRDTIDELLVRVRYGLPEPPTLTLDQIGQVAKEFDIANKAFGEKMNAINREVEAISVKSLSRPTE